MSTTAMQVNGSDRAAVVRAAQQGRPGTQRPVPMGIRVISGPGAPVPTTTPATPEEVTARTVEALLAAAKGSDSARTRALGEKVAALVEELGGRVEAEEARRREQAALEEERRALAEQEAQLAQQLQQVRQRLRGRPAGDGAASPRRSRESAEQRAAIRAWAADNGYELKERGRIPAGVVQAWAAATGSEVTR